MNTDPKLTHLNRKLALVPEPEPEPPCYCFEYVPDNPDCPRHAELFRTYQRQLERRFDSSDNTVSGSLRDAGMDLDGRF